ncbi:hypothetical protein R1flu_022184 [Riccia fluitans]|uniref:Uncharacterized protein n=1 Tax=Riccia fluitans TaxID=41844 RepID=A0ABD1ZSQ6_9MARC
MSRDEVETTSDRLAEDKEVNLKVLKLKQVLESKEINLKVLRLKHILKLAYVLVEALMVATTIADQQVGCKDINLKLLNFKEIFQDAVEEEEA